MTTYAQRKADGVLRYHRNDPLYEWARTLDHNKAPRKAALNCLQVVCFEWEEARNKTMRQYFALDLSARAEFRSTLERIYAADKSAMLAAMLLALDDIDRGES